MRRILFGALALGLPALLLGCPEVLSDFRIVPDASSLADGSGTDATTDAGGGPDTSPGEIGADVSVLDTSDGAVVDSGSEASFDAMLDVTVDSASSGGADAGDTGLPGCVLGPSDGGVNASTIGSCKFQ